MSVRESIAQDIVQTLQGIVTPAPVIVTRNPLQTSDLANTQYPAIFVRTTEEVREDITQGTAGLRTGEIEYTIIGYVYAESSATSANNNIDTKRNELVEAICEELEKDRKRNSQALNSFVTRVTVDDGTIFPVGQVNITYSVLYKYTKGTV
tara:strand:- start:347 stop:799 length:453 start_codon:yes stop_codon:yes gene_type:complete